MRIALINVSGRLSCEGSRLIAALLKQAGHSLKSVFLVRFNPLLYEPREIEKLHEIIKEVDLVMIGVYSAFALRAVQVTEFIRKNYPGMKVIWGGPHCIGAPELSLRYADGVCFAEGDQVIVDFVNNLGAGTDYLNTPNMAFNVNGSIVVNDVLPPFSDLDSLPYSDFSLDDQFLLDQDLYQLTKEKLKEYFSIFPFGVPTFWLLTSRGCPHQCAYCNNCRYIAMHGRIPVRFRGVDHFIGELEYTLNYLDFFAHVGFGDDDFFMRPTGELEDFAEKYKKKVSLPFYTTVSANTFSKQKMEILLDVGLSVVQMGVQSGSQRVLDQVFNRKVQVTKTKEVVRQIAPYQKTHDLLLILDFIIDNPYENEADIAQTYQYLIDLPSKVRINWYTLVFFPGTPIYDRALADGFIEPFSEKTFRFYKGKISYQNNYETALIFLALLLHRLGLMRYIPKFVLRALSGHVLRAIGAVFPKQVYAGIIRRIRRLRFFVPKLSPKLSKKRIGVSL